MVSKGHVVADVGCDHAHTSIWLVEKGIAPKCIAMDLRKGPLSAADENIKNCHCEALIETRLSDGLEKLEPGEADCILISGMGGSLICRILEGKKACLEEAAELVLQPQSEYDLVRHFLHENGFYIAKESCCEDYGKFYVSIHAVKGEESEPYTKSEYEYGRSLPGESLTMYDYLCREEKKIIELLAKLEGNPSDKARERFLEYSEKLELTREAISKYGKREGN